MYAAVTTFPNKYFDTYANNMIESFFDNWPVELFIQLDTGTDTQEIAQRVGETAVKRQKQGHVSGGFPDEFNAFLEDARKVSPPENVPPGESFKYKYIEFSHKVFATYEVMKAIETLNELTPDQGGFPEKVTKLIWIDADVMTTKPLTIEDIEKIQDGASVTYLGRKDWPTSETGFIIFDLEKGGDEVIKEWRQFYLDGKVPTFPEWTDAYVFDRALEKVEKRRKKLKKTDDLILNDLSKDATGRDVFEQTILSEFMTHLKGPKKIQGAPMHSNAMSGQTFDTKNMGIQTKNCVQDDTIMKNVQENLKIIETWLEPCKANNEELIIANAGPSLYPPDFKDKYEQGMKVVAVKHALAKLEKYNMKPWACILLDPRQHVSDFVEYPDRDVLWFVASMVDPQVTRHLIKCGCKVYGYHASVGANEDKVIPKDHKGGKHIMFEGGSATATRGLSLLEAMGFKTMHLYGYDCCYFEKPDLQDRKTNGKLRYEEVTLEVETWGGGVEKRTFWTEGQFLAQIQEYRNLYLPKPGLNLIPYGDGIIPWIDKNIKRFDAWNEKLKDKEKKMLKDTNDVNVWFCNNG